MQVFQSKENIGEFTKLTDTTARLAASKATIGGLQYTISNLDLDISLAGAGGLDTGSIANLTFYYVYLILDSGIPSIICTTNVQQPSGFDTYTKVAAFYTNSSGDIANVYSYLERNEVRFGFTSNAAGVINRITDNFTTPTVNAKIATGIYEIDISDLNLALAPIPVALDATSDRAAVNRINSTTTEVSFLVERKADGLDIDASIEVICSKQGIDSVQPDWKRY